MTIAKCVDLSCPHDITGLCPKEFAKAVNIGQQKRRRRLALQTILFALCVTLVLVIVAGLGFLFCRLMADL